MVKTLNIEIEIPYQTALLKDIRDQVQDALSSLDLTAKQKAMLVLAVDEGVANLLWQGRDSGNEGYLILKLEKNGSCFKATITDYTLFFNGLENMEMSELEKALKKDRRHKLGVFVMRKIMDEVTYLYKKGVQNELVLVKYL